jgi:hypothetical protein
MILIFKRITYELDPRFYRGFFFVQTKVCMTPGVIRIMCGFFYIEVLHELEWDWDGNPNNDWLYFVLRYYMEAKHY